MQLKPPEIDPVSAVCSVFQRFAVVGAAGEVVGQPAPVQVGALPMPLSVQLHEKPSDSGVLPSMRRSIDPELSMSSRTFGGGGFVSTCWARAAGAAVARASPARPPSTADHERYLRVIMARSSSPRTLDGTRDEART